MTENRGEPPVVDLRHSITRIQQFPHDSVPERVLIFQAFKDLVHFRVRKFWHRGIIAYEDCLHEGFIGLYTATEKFDESKGHKFITFATTIIDHRILDYVLSETKHYSNGYRRRVVLDEPHPDRAIDTVEDLADAEIDESFEQSRILAMDAAQLLPVLRFAVSKLPLRQRQAVELFFYADMQNADIAARLKVSRPRVTALLNDAVRRLRRQMKITV